MKLYIANDSQQSIGGGWTFIRNFTRGIGSKVQIVGYADKPNIALIPASTMTDYNKIKHLKDQGVKVVLRVNGIPEDTRNRGTGYSRMKAISSLADKIIFQSHFSKIRFCYAYQISKEDIDKRSTIIHNGVDTNVFNPEGSRYKWGKEVKFLYVQFNRHENKRFQEAREIFRHYKGDKELVIVGRFSQETIEYKFDLYPHEKYRYIPTIEDPRELAKIMRSCNILLFPAFLDNMPNTVLEARACGLPTILHSYGGGIEGYTFENIFLFTVTTDQLWSNPDSITKRIEELLDVRKFSTKKDEILDIKEMANRYYKIFEEVCNESKKK